MTDKETKTMDIVAYSLTKREFFAAMALQGIIANTNGAFNVGVDSRWAVEFADALIKALERGEE